MPGQDEARAKRLAAALRENLRRRKAQSRDLAEQARAESGRDDDRDDQS